MSLTTCFELFLIGSYICKKLKTMINNFFGFTFAISFFLILIGLISPKIAFFWNKKLASRKNVLVFYGITFIISMFIFNPPPPDPKNLVKENKNQEKVIEKERQLTFEEYSSSIENDWNQISLTNDGDFPQYKDYYEALEQIFKKIEDSKKTYDTLSLSKLSNKLSKSKKYTEALSNYIIYGQPMMSVDITYPCEAHIKEYANDPESIDIEKSIITGKTKKGYEVMVKYRGNNAFGGKVLNISSFDVRYNFINNSFYVFKMHN